MVITVSFQWWASLLVCFFLVPVGQLGEWAGRKLYQLIERRIQKRENR